VALRSVRLSVSKKSDEKQKRVHVSIGSVIFHA